MIRPYSIDAYTQAQDLASSVLTSSSLSSIFSAISTTDSILRKLSPEQSRAFFSIAFPAIICRIFGFDDSSSNPVGISSAPTSWIDQAHHVPELAARLLDLLSPHGPLLSSISSVDRIGLVKYVFPTERLPEWMRFALQKERCPSVLSDLCPILKGRIKEDPIQGTYHLHLNAFEYYIFWFVYYPVCRGNCRSSDCFSTQKVRRKSRVESWTSSLPVIVNPSKKFCPKADVCLYSRLLYSYLCTFVPKDGLNFNRSYCSSLRHYSSRGDLSIFEQSEFMVYTLIHFWLVDNDFSPFSITVFQASSASILHRSPVVHNSPTAGLGEMGRLFVKYLTYCLAVLAKGSNQRDWRSVGTTSMRSISFIESTSWNSAIQRPLYRFLLRNFLLCPNGVSIKDVSHAVSMWVTYMEPWRTNLEDFAEIQFLALCKSETLTKGLNQEKIIGENEKRSLPSVCTPLWEDYVASNYLFYSSLFCHFLRFAHNFLHVNAKTIADMMLKVLKVLTSSKELIDLLHKVDSALHSKQPRLYSCPNMEKYAPLIYHQLKDWEHGLCEIGASCKNGSRYLEFFSDGENSPLKLLQIFVFRAEDEMYTYPVNRAQICGQIDLIKDQISILFDAATAADAQPKSSNTTTESPARCIRKDAFAPKHPGIEACKWADIGYKGDWMHRPVSEMEAAWLARLLIRFSDWLNDLMNLRRNPESGAGCVPAYVSQADCEWSFESGLTFICSLLGLCRDLLVRFMRGHGIRINLRVLSSKKFLLFLLVYVMGYVIKKAYYYKAWLVVVNCGWKHSR